MRDPKTKYSYCVIDVETTPDLDWALGHLAMQKFYHRGRAEIDERVIHERELEESDPEIFETHEFECDLCVHKLTCLLDPLKKVFYKKA